MAVFMDAAGSDPCALLSHMTNAKYWLNFPSNHKTTGVTGGAFIMEVSGGRSRSRSNQSTHLGIHKLTNAGSVVYSKSLSLHYAKKEAFIFQLGLPDKAGF